MIIHVVGVDNRVLLLNDHPFLEAFVTFLKQDNPFQHKITASVDHSWGRPNSASQ